MLAKHTCSGLDCSGICDLLERQGFQGRFELIMGL